jgi:DNA invertase Pin-like site-specific DNA recombinase
MTAIAHDPFLADPTPRKPILLTSGGEYSNHIRRVSEQAAKGAELLIRFSTEDQLESSKGSIVTQKLQMEYLRPYGLQPEDVRETKCAESASGKLERPVFDALVARIRRGDVGILITAFADRLARNMNDFHDLAQAMRSVRGLIVLDGRFFDMASQWDVFNFYNVANQAVLQSVERQRLLLSAQCARARDLAFPVSLPVGYVWASPEDAHYVKALEAAGLQRMLETVPSAHRTRVVVDGRSHYALPFPDAEVYRSLELRRDVIREARDIRAIMDLVQSDSRWPRPGHVPHRRSYHYDGGRVGMEWRPIESLLASGAPVTLRWMLRRWYGSPALYGTYRFAVPDVRELDFHLLTLGADVEVPLAFPSLFAPEEQSEIREILRSRQALKTFVSVSTMTRVDQPPAPAILPQVSCAEKWGPHGLCGLTLTPMRLGGAAPRVEYGSGICHVRHGPMGRFSWQMEAVLVPWILGRLSPTAIDAVLSTLTRGHTVARHRVRDVERRLRREREDVGYRERELLAALQAQHVHLAATFRESLHEAADRVAALERELRLARHAEHEDLALLDDEQRKLRRLAADLPTLWTQAAAIPGLQSRLMRAFITGIHVRYLGTKCMYVEVEWPSRRRDSLVIVGGATDVPLAALVYADQRLRDQLDTRLLAPLPEDWTAVDAVAAEISTRFPRQDGTPYRGPYLRAALIAWRIQQTEATHPGSHPLGETVAMLATRLGLPVDLVEPAAIQGRLGPSVQYDTDVYYQPTESDLCRALLPYAAKTVAEGTGWALDDVITHSDAARWLGSSRNTLYMLCEKHGVTFLDAGGRRWTRRSWLQARLAPELSDAVATLALPGVEASDFVLVTEAITWLRARLGRPIDYPWLADRRLKGRILVVEARGVRGIRDRALWVYLPPAVRALDSRDALRVWLAGTRRDLTPWSPAGARPRRRPSSS